MIGFSPLNIDQMRSNEHEIDHTNKSKHNNRFHQNQFMVLEPNQHKRVFFFFSLHPHDLATRPESHRHYQNVDFSSIYQQNKFEPYWCINVQMHANVKGFFIQPIKQH